MAKLQVVWGSPSDEGAVNESGMLKILDEVIGREAYEKSSCSAHRNPVQLAEFVHRALDGGTQVLIGIAGMACALPGAMSANCESMRLVIGVPMDEDGIDSCLYMPPGVPVATAGVGKAGLKNAALMACQALAIGDDSIPNKLAAYLMRTAKEPQFNID